MESVSKSKLPSWVFWSTRESINNDIPSVAAIVETMLAVVVYWSVAIYFETYLPLLIGVAVAPLVLLRSDRSVALGVIWFIKWLDASRPWQPNLSTARLVQTVALSITIFLGIASTILARGIIVGTDGWTAFWRGFVMALTALPLSIFLSTALSVAAFGSSSLDSIAAGKLSSKWIIAGIVVAVAVISTGASIGGAGPMAIGGALLAVGAIFGMIVLASFPHSFLRIPGYLLFVVPTMVGFIVGIYAVSILVRLGATSRHLIEGLKTLPRNFQRLTLCTSPLQEPELIPELSLQMPELSLPAVLKRSRENFASAKGDDRTVTLISVLAVFLLWFFPAWIYRITLKSTSWFWWPLAFLGSDLRRARHPELFRQDLMDTLQAKASVVLAAGAILMFVFINLFLSGVFAQPNPFLATVGFLFLVDWRSLGIWQIIAVAAALISVAGLFWADRAGHRYRYAVKHDDKKLLDETEVQFGWMERLLRIRLLLVVAFWLIVAAHSLLLFNSVKCWFDVPANVERHAKSLYGSWLPVRKCAN